MKRTSRRLSLSKDTVRPLSNDHLQRVIGGVDELSRRKCTTISKSDLCPTNSTTVPIYSEASCPAVSCGCDPTITQNP